MSKDLVIVAGGPLTDRCRTRIQKLCKGREDAVAIACDSGIETFYELQITPNYLIGDLDSTSPQTLLWAKSTPKIEIEQFQSDKDETDLELALRFCDIKSAKSVSLFGILEGREDFTISNLHLISSYAQRHLEVEFIIHAKNGKFLFPAPHTEHKISARKNQLFSLIPFSEVVEGVTLSNAKWPLNDAQLKFGSGWGVSNEGVGEKMTLLFSKGSLGIFIFE